MEDGVMIMIMVGVRGSGYKKVGRRGLTVVVWPYTDDRPIDNEAYPFCFLVCTLSKEMVLAADSAEERRRWLEQLRCVAWVRRCVLCVGVGMGAPHVH